MDPNRRQHRILLIDDNKHGLRARRIILEDLGYEVATAETGEEGVRRFSEALDSRAFSVVVTDYRMPGICGDEVVRRVRALAPRQPIVILSGYTDVLALAPESTGADAVLAKGSREQFDLADAVRDLVAGADRPQAKPPASERVSSTGKAGTRQRRASARR